MISPRAYWDLGYMLFVLGLALAITLSVEVTVASLFRVGFRGIAAVVLVNVLTNPSANLLVAWLAITGSGYAPFHAVLPAATVLGLEALIVLLEWRLLVWSAARSAKESRRMLHLSVAMNCASALAGVVLYVKYLSY